MEDNKKKTELSSVSYEGQISSTKNILSNIIVVIFSNLLTTLSGVLIGFIIPKIMGIIDFGYYKTFTLYASYIGLFHFGFIDGIYLYYAGKKYDELDKEKFRLFTHFLFFITLIITLIFISIGCCLYGIDAGLILIFVGLDVMTSIMTCYYETLTQITMQFKKLSFRSVLTTSLKIVSVVVLYLLYKFAKMTIYFWIYIVCYLVIKYILTFWYIFTYRDISFGKGVKFKDVKGEIFNYYKIGFPLLVSNLVGQFIFIVDQQIVNIFFDVQTYSTYAFAYSMINLITIATSAISTVLYPTLKTMDENQVKEDYSKLNAILLIFISFCLLSYFMLVPFISFFLADYIPSLITFRIVLPGVLISSSISVIKYNCYKKFNMIGNYFIKSLIILIIAIIADLAVFYIFKSTNGISIISIFVLILWYILIELNFIRKYHVHWMRNFAYMVLSIANFYACTFIPNIWGGMGIYVLNFALLSIIIYNKKLSDIISLFFRKR